jgi:hypothetical protein
MSAAIPRWREHGASNHDSPPARPARAPDRSCTQLERASPTCLSVALARASMFGHRYRIGTPDRRFACLESAAVDARIAVQDAHCRRRRGVPARQTARQPLARGSGSASTLRLAASADALTVGATFTSQGSGGEAGSPTRDSLVVATSRTGTWSPTPRQADAISAGIWRPQQCVSFLASLGSRFTRASSKSSSACPLGAWRSCGPKTPERCNTTSTSTTTSPSASSSSGTGTPRRSSSSRARWRPIGGDPCDEFRLRRTHR